MRYAPTQQLWLFPDARPPLTDNEKIKAAELRYRENKKDAAKELFYSLTGPARRMVRFERKKKGFFLTPEDEAEKALIAAEYIMEQYIKRPDFALKTPSAYIYLRVLAALYRHKKIEEYITYTDKEF